MTRYAIPIPASQGARIDYFDVVVADIGDTQSVASDLSTFSGHVTMCREIIKLANTCYTSQQQTIQSSSDLNSHTHSDNRDDDCDIDDRDVDDDIDNDNEQQHSYTLSPVTSTPPPPKPTKQYALVLMDEIGSGTDPAQGAAFAQAILEELVTLNARLMVSTHYNRLKELAVTDPRFQIAAMEFIHQQPTYRMLMHSVGESHALELAQRIALPTHVLDRAYSLLDTESQRLIALQSRLTQETDAMHSLQEEYQEKLSQLSEQEKQLQQKAQHLEQKIQQIQEQKYEEYLVDIKQKEQQVEEMMLRIQELIYEREEYNHYLQKQIKQVSLLATSVATTNAVSTDSAVMITTTSLPANFTMDNDSMDIRQMEDIQQKLKKERIIIEKQVNLKILDDLKVDVLDTESVEAGDTLIILETGNLFASKAIVTQRNFKGKGRIVVKVAGVELKMERHLLGKPRNSGSGGSSGNSYIVGTSTSSSSSTTSLGISKADISRQKAKQQQQQQQQSSTSQPLKQQQRDTVDNNNNNDDSTNKLTEKQKRMLQFIEEELVDPNKMIQSKKQQKAGLMRIPRTSSNTVDIREVNTLDDMQPKILKFFDNFLNDMLARPQTMVSKSASTTTGSSTSSSSSTVVLDPSAPSLFVVYIAHGVNHPVKNKLRNWLREQREVKSCQAAALSEGGDAYTIVELDL
jgi:hypothetical protein